MKKIVALTLLLALMLTLAGCGAKSPVSAPENPTSTTDNPAAVPDDPGNPSAAIENLEEPLVDPEEDPDSDAPLAGNETVVFELPFSCIRSARSGLA